jgi:hypothetical protein
MKNVRVDGCCVPMSSFYSMFHSFAISEIMTLKEIYAWKKIFFHFKCLHIQVLQNTKFCVLEEARVHLIWFLKRNTCKWTWDVG